MSSSFDVIEVVIEIVVGEEFLEDSVVTSFRHKRSNDELNFGMIGRWLVDLEDEVEFPREVGKYTMDADWNDDSEVIDCIYNVRKVG